MPNRRLHQICAISLILAGSPVLSQSGTPVTPTVPVGLGPFVIGMTLDEARAVPLKGLSSGASPKLSCTGEGATGIYTSAELVAEGVAECEPARVIYASPSTTPVYFGNIVLQPTFSFYQGKLYKIVIRPHTNWLPEFQDALIAKYGKPTKQAAAEVSNAYGAKWPQITSEWRFGAQSITLIAPDYKRDEFSTEYADAPLNARIEAAVRARKAAGAGI